MVVDDDYGATREIAKYILSVIRNQDLPSLQSSLQSQSSNISNAFAGIKFITQEPSTLLTNEQALSSLSSGYLKNTTGTGVLSVQTTPIPVPDGGTGLTSLTANGIMYASGTTTLATSSNLVYSGGYLGVGTSSPGSPLHGVLTDATTNAVGDLLTLTHNSSGTPAAGFGGALVARLHSSTTQAQLAGRLSWHWTTATDASRAARGRLTAYYTSTERECIAWEANSSAPMAGFLGASPVIRQVVSGNNGGISGLTGFLTALANLGLITDSTTNSASIPTGSGATNRIAYWSGTSTLTSDAGFTFTTSGYTADIATGAAATSGQWRIGHVATSDYLRIIHVSQSQMSIDKFASSGQAIVDINPRPGDGTSAANFRFFRSTSTSGATSFDIFLGDGSASFNARIFGQGANTYFCANNGSFGVGTASPATQFHTVLTDATTNAVVNSVTSGHNSSGTPAAGFGSGLLFNLHSSTTTAQSAARLTIEWVTATHASRAARGSLTAYYTSTERTCFQWEANSTVALVGFLGTAPVAKQTVTGSRGGNAALASVLTALANFGLITDSSTA